MKFTVPTNWQDDILDKLCTEAVEEVYGKLERDFIGGGRAAFTLQPVNSKKARKHIASLLAKGKKFNYLLNSTCMENIEFTRSGQVKIRMLLDWLSDSGVSSVTVALPYLLEVVKKSYPHLKVCVSTQAGVREAAQARQWQSLGADSITLSFVDVNRSPELIRWIRQATDCRLLLIANLDCLRNCPFFYYHSCINSHASQSGHASKGFLIDYCFLKCSILKLNNPMEFIRSPWIRPEDVGRYERLGIDAIKLVNRSMSSEALGIVIDAYTLGEYRGNLLDLFSEPCKTLVSKKRSILRKMKFFLRPALINVFKLYHFRNIFPERQIYIDNKALDSFVDYFFNAKCLAKNCHTCGYCREIAEKTVKINEEYREKALLGQRELVESVLSGDIFKYF